MTSFMAATPAEAVLAHDGKRILLVEDDIDTVAILTELLNAAGYQVRTERSASDALAGNLDEIDLLISDIGLPGFSGLELMRQLRSRSKLRGVGPQRLRDRG
jgi:DNA-binding response OmpR family regulator